MIPEVFQQCEENISVSCSRKTMTNFDISPPIPVSWDSVVVPRTVDRRTGVVIAEEVMCHLEPKQRQRPFQGKSPKEVLTVFFSWNDNPPPVRAYAVEAPSPKTLINLLFRSWCNDTAQTRNYFQDPHTVRL